MQNRIKDRIKEKGIKQTELADMLQMTTVGINQLINSAQLKIETYEKIAAALGIPVWMLVLSDEEIADIRSKSPDKRDDVFHCPKCGAPLKVVPDEV